MNSKLVIVLSALTIGVGAVVFGYFTVESMKIDRSHLVQKKIKVVSYPAFVSSYGPGPELARRFEERTGVKVELVNGGDPILIINRLLADKNLKADVLFGIDQMSVSRAMKLKWKPLDPTWRDLIRKELLVFGDSPFLPVDWAPLTFIFKAEEKRAQPQRLSSPAEFYSKEYTNKPTLALQDPRASVLGRQWLYWFSSQEVKADQLGSLSTQVLASWSQAYGQFKKKSVDFVFSYLTSVVFHWGQEEDRSYSYFEFENGHPFQVNAAGVLARCGECDASSEFLRFLLEPGSQALIMQKDYMLPAAKSIQPSGLFAELPQLKLISYEELSQFESQEESQQEKYLRSMD